MTQRNLDAVYRAFGNLVRLGRERRDLSQEKLGRFVGLSRTSIVNLETGPSRYTYQLLGFARALEMPPEALLPSTRLTARHYGARKASARRNRGQWREKLG
jgi:DNA-binding XRE family transcriptional regulator